MVEAIIKAKEKYKYALWAYVIMPEHVHLLVYPMIEKYNISSFLKTLKQSVARKAKYYLNENNPAWLNKLTVKRGQKNVFRFWQTGPGYDRNINSEDELFEKIIYIHNNPVKRELVTEPQQWKWSSAGWYEGERDVILPINDLEVSSHFT